MISVFKCDVMMLMIAELLNYVCVSVCLSACLSVSDNDDDDDDDDDYGE